jgi:hypothetical protein
MADRPSTLWLTLPAPSRVLVLGWLAWMLAAAALGRLVVGAVGPAGVAGAVVLMGAWLARRLPGPHECAHRHHVDDMDVLRMGPGRIVHRLEWSEVARCTQTARSLVLAGGGRRIALPLAGLVDAGVWGGVLARVVPRRAEALWQALDGGAVALRPPLEPPLGGIVAWCWAPLAVAAFASDAGIVGAIGSALAVGERAVVAVRRRLRTVVLQPAGLVVPGSRGRFFAPWDGVTVEPGPAGLVVRSARGTGLVPAELDDFWPAAAVIELHAQLGFSQPDLVRFRVHVDGADVAVVGEVDGA